MMRTGLIGIESYVDGTLIRSCGEDANRLHKEAFSAGFKHVFGVDTTIDVVKHHGGTDPLIAVKQRGRRPAAVLHSPRRRAAAPPLQATVFSILAAARRRHAIVQALERLPELQAAMIKHFEAHSDRAGLGLQLLPGVRALLETLQGRDDVATCLVTGNLEPIGWGKMAALGIEQLFTAPRFGGFGSDHCSGDTDEMWRDRAEFVAVAARRCADAFPDADIAAHWHVGDTPMDVQAALASGAAALGVATGVFPLESLRALGAPPRVVVLESLEDTEAVMAALGLS
ncbi:hypothetical protein MNEG_5646 [Monoraphidium neglectum]|uniref:HAD family hydrolase n=1 Tax=Monoraphidium neglectum TaxID=145388 RepID=A0A0D2JTR6_9CHLO|nr:hypothetical protein MNEG_5646 [Monoraphidium neglectum]KIZ02313.1 hypothetical protein MNEG_5646 [Monoraphidium neglectum]|eukprot:XP_013901332.1 hypothetical protein MNEG_5646 [Monoraphidium neglectum]